MPRYEFSEGSSNKFWEIKLDGASFTTTYGENSGASGQTTIKKWKDAAQAKLEYEKLVAEKTKKGYALVGGNGKANGAKAAPAPAKAAKAPAKAANGKRYFELVDGSSSKFWEAGVDGTTLKTRHGKIGATGQIVIKEFSSKADASAAMDKLIAEKTKKGYVEGGGGGEPPADDAEPAETNGSFKRDARNPDLEKAIAADPFDRQAYAVFGDWLQEQGDPRGELIALQLAYKDKAGKALHRRARRLLLGIARRRAKDARRAVEQLGLAPAHAGAGEGMAEDRRAGVIVAQRLHLSRAAQPRLVRGRRVEGQVCRRARRAC